MGFDGVGFHAIGELILSVLPAVTYLPVSIKDLKLKAPQTLTRPYILPDDPILWDDDTEILWDDDTVILWDN